VCLGIANGANDFDRCLESNNIEKILIFQKNKN
jgi:hypothetical protein